METEVAGRNVVRTIVAIAVGAVLALMVGWVNWAVLNLWGGAFKSMPAAVEAELMPMLESRLGPGTWFFPGLDMDAAAKMPEADQLKAFEAYSAVHEKGPVGWIMVSPGSVPMAPSTFARAMVFNVLGALGVALVLVGSTGGLAVRWLRATAVVALVTTVFYGALVNWMAMPASFIGQMAADIILTWSIVALVMAVIMGGGAPNRA